MARKDCTGSGRSWVGRYGRPLCCDASPHHHPRTRDRSAPLQRWAAMPHAHTTGMSVSALPSISGVFSQPHSAHAPLATLLSDASRVLTKRAHMLRITQAPIGCRSRKLVRSLRPSRWKCQWLAALPTARIAALTAPLRPKLAILPVLSGFADA
jgi:hypothetical protein